MNKYFFSLVLASTLATLSTTTHAALELTGSGYIGTFSDSGSDPYKRYTYIYTNDIFFDVSQSGNVDISVLGNDGLKPKIDLFTLPQDGIVKKENYLAGTAGASAHLNRDLPVGEYFLHISATDFTGSYRGNPNGQYSHTDTWITDRYSNDALPEPGSYTFLITNASLSSSSPYLTGAVTPVPLPSSSILFGISLLGFAGLYMRRKNQAQENNFNNLYV